MLVFPNSKINLGLHVTEKRNDGFHNIETVFYPVDWCDALEILEATGQKAFTLSQSGLVIDGDLENNLLFKAWQLLSNDYKIPPINVHLHKNIPMGAGLGGGSADAAFFMKALNQKFELEISDSDLATLVSVLGSDCAFFINNRPLLALEKGNVFSDIQVDLKSYFIALVYPNLHSNTKDAYAGLVPKKPIHNLKRIIENENLKNWKELLVNDFEESIFKKYPTVKLLKENLYARGALYASMSGSGSAVFGIFENEPVLNLDPSFKYCLQKPAANIL
ncbi:MAG: 4-(cytidine 5'-diphospho)-2-C-methyl-D-erythritol kinase [Bacteroidia bacterium]|nr:4-(cytidine 5'-diphospho)-2-C-methyl-D-erythritol kinase [Bacteroidia bacterium]